LKTERTEAQARTTSIGADVSHVPQQQKSLTQRKMRIATEEEQKSAQKDLMQHLSLSRSNL
jgi:hypothetical protein